MTPSPFDYDAFFADNWKAYLKKHPIKPKLTPIPTPVFYKEALQNPYSEEASKYLKSVRRYLSIYTLTKRTPKHKRKYLLPSVKRQHRILRQLLRFASTRAPLPHIFRQYLHNDTTPLTLRPKHPRHQKPHPDTLTTWKQQLEQNPLLIAPPPC